MPGRIEFEFTTRSKGPRGPRAESSPMRILVLGDFSAHGLNGGSKEQPPISQRKLHPVDLDNLDQVLGRMAPELSLSLGENLAARVSFSEIEDCHPDSLFRRVPLFDELRPHLVFDRFPHDWDYYDGSLCVYNHGKLGAAGLQDVAVRANKRFYTTCGWSGRTMRSLAARPISPMDKVREVWDGIWNVKRLLRRWDADCNAFLAELDVTIGHR